MKNIGNLCVRLFVISLLTFRYFSTIVSLFGAGAAPFFTAPAPAPAPSKPFRRLRLRLRLRPKCVGSGGSGSGSGSGSASLLAIIRHFSGKRWPLFTFVRIRAMSVCWRKRMQMNGSHLTVTKCRQSIHRLLNLTIPTISSHSLFTNHLLHLKLI